MTSRILGHRAPLLWIALPLIGGLAAGKASEIEDVRLVLGGAFLAAVLAVAAAWKRSSWWSGSLIVALFLAGNASYIIHRARLVQWEELPPREAQLTLRVERVFTQQDPRKASGLATILHAGSPVTDVSGQKIYFSLALRPGTTAPLRSQEISAVGILATLPLDPPSDSFDAYLGNAGVNFRFTRGRVREEVKPASAYYRFCAAMAAKFSHLLGVGVAQAQSESVAALRAMMLGQQGELSDEQDRLFRESGTMHMFSISGLHVAVIAGGLQTLLALLRLPRGAQFAFGLGALWLYVDITGAAPSAIRAFIMVVALQASFLLRVPGNPLSALAASAVAVLLFEPMQIFGASFQLSYGIVAALLLLGLPLGEIWSERAKLFVHLPKKAWSWHHHARDAAWRAILSSLGLGIAATLVSALSGILFFKLFTPGALIANLLLIPGASLVIVAGFVSLLGGLLGLTSVSILFNHAAVLLLAGIDAAVRVFVQLPAMWFAAVFKTSWVGVLSFGVLMALLLFGYRQRWDNKRGGFWMPFAFVMFALIFGVKFG